MSNSTLYQLHPSHRLDAKPLSRWRVCAKCGLVMLKNAVSKCAAAASCSAKDE